MRILRHTMQLLRLTLAAFGLCAVVGNSSIALSLVRGTPQIPACNRDKVQVNYLGDAIAISRYLDSTGNVDPAPVPMTALRALNVDADHFPDSQALVGIIMADGSTETLIMFGPTTLHVFLDEVAGTDEDHRGQVPTEMVELSLTGNSQVLGTVRMRLRGPAAPPLQQSIGEIEENVNNAPGVLDLPPYTFVGTADAAPKSLRRVGALTPQRREQS